MKTITVDFETYYDSNYSLSKLTTEEYIRDDRFEVIGVAVQVDDESPVWFAGEDGLKEFLDSYDWGNSIAVAHNAMFDMAILSWRFGIRPLKIADTLSMARASHSIEVGGSLKALVEYYGLGVKGTEVLDAKGKRRCDFDADQLDAYANYCKNDVALTYSLFETFLDQGFPVFELRLIDLTLRMFTEPTLQINKEILRAHLDDLVETKREWLIKADVDIENLTSNNKFAELLRSFDVEPPTKISLTTGKETYAFAKTDEGLKKLMEHENPMVQTLVAARLGIKSTIEETRTERFMSIADRGPLPIPLRYYAAHTGRWGGDDKINMQNLPRDSIIRYSIIPPSGYVFIDYDSSQIEARTLAWLSEQDDLVAAFDEGEDVYKIMASAIYNKPIDEVTKDERFVGKTTILGCGYGMGANRFQSQLKNFGVTMDVDECQRIIDVYRDRYKKIPELWRESTSAIRAMLEDRTKSFGCGGLLSTVGNEGVLLPNDMKLKYPNLREEEDGEREGQKQFIYDTKRGKTIVPNKIYGGKLVENVCQALARIIIGEQLLKVADKYKVVMTVHDSIGCIAPESEAEEAVAYVGECMRFRPSWAPTLPLNCDGSYGYSYGECK
jgi:DNA polymerase